MEFLDLENGFRLAYNISGNPSGPKMVLIHGLFLNSDCWEKQLSYFERDFHVLRFDLRGHGRSTKPEERFTIKDYVKDMYLLLKSLKWTENLFLVGHSLGAMISLVYGLQFPDQVKKIVCASGFCFVSLEAETDVLGRVDKYPIDRFAMGISKRGLNPYNEETARFVAKQVTDHLTKEQCLRATAASAGFNICEYLKDLNIPILLLVGQKDITTPMWASEMLQDWLADSKIEIIPNGGHLIILDHADVFNKLVENFWKNSR
ncbi:MAG: alpha/beta fold hydrolase [Candidatus Lokiarchaeota archaeon]|nr:alpha/beta fold hydrolase [Candidatus Lokiarchaeota archaeon]